MSRTLRIFALSLVLACLGASALASPRLRVAGISLPCPGGVPQAFTAGKSFFAYAGQEAPNAPLETVHEVLDLPILEPVARPVFSTANALLPPEVHEAALLTLVNTERATAGLSGLQTNDFAQTTARSWSQQMMAARAISHNDAYIATGRAGTGGDALGENVACDYSIPTMHTGLMNSPSHRVNILDPKWTHIGVGIALDPTGYLYGTEAFVRISGAKPAPPPAAPRPAAPQAPRAARAPAAPPATVLAAAPPPPPPPLVTILLPEVPKPEPRPPADVTGLRASKEPANDGLSSTWMVVAGALVILGGLGAFPLARLLRARS